MIAHLLENMNQNEAEIQKMLFSLPKNLINIGSYSSQNMNLAEEAAKMLIMY